MQPEPSRKDVIRNAAAELFVKQGYSSTSMRDLAKAVGLLPGSLYAHIESKEQLLLEIVESGVDSFLAAVEQVLAMPEPADVKLRAAISSHIGLVAQNPRSTQVVFHQWRALTGDPYRRVVAKRNRYEESFTELLTQGVASGTFSPAIDVRIAVLVILGALNWAHEWLSPEGRATPFEVGERVGDLLVAAVTEQGRMRVVGTNECLLTAERPGVSLATREPQ